MRAISMVVAIVVLAVACSRGDRAGEGRAGQDSAVMAGVESLAVGHPAFGTNDSEVIGTLDEANAADSSGGAMAVAKGRSADVKSFGRLMMAEHHALRLQGQTLARRLNLTADTGAVARVRAQHDSASRRLGALSGAEFDRAYIDHEVQMHEQVLRTVQRARGATASAELKSLLQQAEPVIQRHLDRAKEIRGRLTS